MKEVYSILLVVFVIGSCNPDKAYIERITEIEQKYGAQSYEASLAYMSYLMKRENNLEYSLELVNKLISNERFTEARYALVVLSEQFSDERLFYLQAVCFRNEFQFERAKQAIRKALEISQKEILNLELANIIEDGESWRRLKEVDRKIKVHGLKPELRIGRAEVLMNGGYFSAALLDLDTLISNGMIQDRAYSLKIRALIYMKNYQKADSTLALWKEIVSDEWKGEVNRLSAPLKGISEVQTKISDGLANANDYFLMTGYFSRLSLYAEAEGLIEKGLRKFPDDLNLSYARLLIYTESEQKEKARRVSEQLKEAGVSIPAEIKKYLEE